MVKVIVIFEILVEFWVDMCILLISIFFRFCDRLSLVPTWSIPFTFNSPIKFHESIYDYFSRSVQFWLTENNFLRIRPSDKFRFRVSDFSFRFNKKFFFSFLHSRIYVRFQISGCSVPIRFLKPFDLQYVRTYVLKYIADEKGEVNSELNLYLRVRRYSNTSLKQ